MSGITIKLSSAIALDGTISRAGSLVEVDDALAKDILRRGKGLLATADDIAAAEAEAAGSPADDAPAPAAKTKRAAAPAPAAE